ncbi:MAG: glycosyltransferase [Actinobacteria bacterium]|nr:glycosyltransferase [Actinomycetota bacterium]
MFANALSELYGKDNIILVPSSSDYEPEESYYKFKVVFSKGVVGSGFLKIFNPLTKAINCLFILIKYRPSIVFISHIDLSITPFVFSRLLLRKVVLLTYGSEVWNKLNPFKLWVLRNTDAVCVISKYTAQKLEEKGVKNKKIFMMPNAIDFDIFKPKERNSNLMKELNLKDDFVLLTVGRMDKSEQHKGHDIAIEALSLVVNSYKKIRYLIVGSGDDVPRLKEMAVNLGVMDFVDFIGNVSESELVDYYNLCDVYLMPNRIEVKNGVSIGEGFGIVFLEANACGKPVIAGNMGGSVEAVVDGYNGLIVNSLSKEDAAEKIKLLIENKDMAKKMGGNGLEFVKSRYSREILIEKIQGLISCMRI